MTAVFLIGGLVGSLVFCSVLLLTNIIIDAIRAKKERKIVQEYRITSIENDILEIKRQIEKKRR